jgi:hypothetical protein
MPGQTYTIVVEGHLEASWAGWFADLAISYDDGGNTILRGPIVDQPALRGLLCRIWDLNLTVISVNQTRDAIAHCAL